MLNQLLGVGCGACPACGAGREHACRFAQTGKVLMCVQAQGGVSSERHTVSCGVLIGLLGALLNTLWQMVPTAC